MKPWIISFLSLFICSGLVGNELPQIIDFKTAVTPQNETLTQTTYELGICAFNSAPELTPFFAALKRDYQIDTVVETGTLFGASTVAFSILFDEVHTIEVIDETYQIAKTRLDKFSNIICYQGSSEDVLRDLLPKLKEKRILFYLDAHWHSHWPLLAELEEIAKTHRNNCIIVIDDFKVPGRNDIPYDAYGPHECSREYIADKLTHVFSRYSFHYLIPNCLNSRAKFVAIPRSWAN